MSMEIIVTIKSVYGNSLVYPICQKAMLFADIAGTATLTDDTIRSIKTLGYRVKVQPITTEL